jgi:hypothetical protein
MIAHYPMNAEKVPFLQHARSSLVIALVGHLGIFGFIFAIVIPTRLLVRSTPPPTPLAANSLDRAGGERQADPHAAHDGSRVSVPGLPLPQGVRQSESGGATGWLCLLLTYLRFDCSQMVWKTASSSTSSTPVQRMAWYANGVKIGSLSILLTPTVTLYFNTSIKYAIGSAMLQIVTEIAAKIVTAYMIKKQVFSHVKVAVIGPASKDAGDHQDGQQVGASKGREDDEEQRGDAESKKKRALAMIAVRWHAEIVAEKGSILAAALIAYLYFADLVDTDSTGLVLIGTVFFSAEALCDFIFVWVMDGHMDVPMLRAVAYEPLLSKESVLGAVMLALTFVSMSGCIAMAASIEL